MRFSYLLFTGLLALLVTNKVINTNKPTKILLKEDLVHKKPVKKKLSIKHILHEAQKKKGIARPEISYALKDLVKYETRQYDIAYHDYITALNEYKSMSSQFDKWIKENRAQEQLASLDQDMQQVAKDLIDLGYKLNVTYTRLMKRYDEAIPQILAKHF